MSFADRLVLWLHIGFAIFTIGPVTVAIMSTPRYIRARNVAILRYLRRMIQIFGLISLAVLIFGIILGQQLDLLDKPWIASSMTLFVVSLALLVIIVRDQRRAINALEKAAAAEALAPETAAGVAAGQEAAAAAGAAGAGQASGSAAATSAGQAGPAQTARHLASVERGRITTLGAVVTVIWLVILVLMVWK